VGAKDMGRSKSCYLNGTKVDLGLAHVSGGSCSGRCKSGITTI